ncbi:branched-chain amino acid ABC transporter permease [Anaerolineales bacterium HSG25]|nr:branched-chain amino acid ABC transporter permease [Anaerolineales bacterium HSG25]
MSLTSNVLLYIIVSYGLGYLFRNLKNPDDTPKINWQMAGVIIGVTCAVANLGLALAGSSFGGAFNLDQPLGPIIGNLGTGLLIGLPIGMIAAYDMSKRFTIIDAWLLFFKIAIIYVVIGGSISSLAVPRYTTEQWFDFFIFGLAQGGIYALIALGYTLVYGILFMINFAHGEVFMAGAFTAFFIARRLAEPAVEGGSAYLDTNPFMSLVLIFAVSMITSTVVAVLLERIAYRPLRRAPRLVPLITAIGASFFLQYTFRGFYGSGVQAYPQVNALKGDLQVADFMLFIALLLIGLITYFATTLLLSNRLKKALPHLGWAPPTIIGIIILLALYLLSSPLQSVLVSGANIAFPLAPEMATELEITTRGEYELPISRIQFVIITSSILMMLGLYTVVQRTKIGRAMRAVAEDKDVAALMGVDVDRVITMTFVMGAMLAGAAGVLYALIFRQVHFFMGFLPGLKAFTAAVLGGIGNIPGAMLGGFFLGIVESLGPSLFLEGLGIPAAYQLKDVIAFTMLVLVLIFRPAGIMGVDLSKKKA